MSQSRRAASNQISRAHAANTESLVLPVVMAVLDERLSVKTIIPLPARGMLGQRVLRATNMLRASNWWMVG